MLPIAASAPFRVNYHMPDRVWPTAPKPEPIWDHRMPGPNDSSRSQSTAEGSFFDLLEETLGLLERGVRGQFLAQFFKSFAHIDLSSGDSAAVWDRVLVRHRELSESMSRPVSLKTAMMDVLESMDLLQVPILVEYRELRQLKVSAGSDALTGLYNRRLFEEYFEKELSRAKRGSGQLALVVMDLHRFKEINDRYGHQQGDQASAAGRRGSTGHGAVFRLHVSHWRGRVRNPAPPMRPGAVHAAEPAPPGTLRDRCA